MKKLLADVDRLLRGEYTRQDDLAAGRIAIPTRTLLAAGLLLGAVYGAFMGLYAVLRPESAGVAQLVATTVKVPLLFLLTLVVTFPSLYVFSALARSRLDGNATLRLLLGAIAVNLALLTSLAPVTGFFTLSTESYHFMVALNVAFFAVAGVVGLQFLRRALEHLFGLRVKREADGEDEAEDGAEDGEDWKASRLEVVSQEGPRRVFRLWIFIYGVVGAQMGWVLRPFVGSPGQPFTLFRERESNFFASVWAVLQGLLS